jgi:hypothetical protein
MKVYGGVDLQIHIFLTSALVGGEWSVSCPGRLTPGEKAPGTHWIGGWVDPRVGLDDVEKWIFFTLPGLELRSLCLAGRNQSLYRLRYPGSSKNICEVHAHGTVHFHTAQFSGHLPPPATVYLNLTTSERETYSFEQKLAGHAEVRNWEWFYRLHKESEEQLWAQ